MEEKISVSLLMSFDIDNKEEWTKNGWILGILLKMHDMEKKEIQR